MALRNEQDSSSVRAGKAKRPKISVKSPADTPQPLTEHLEELRRRLMWCAGGVTLGSVAGYFLTDSFINYLAQTVGNLIFIRPTEAFLVKIRLSVVLGILFSVPLILYQVWRFVGLALSVDEKRVVLGVLPFSFLLFAAGAGFSWFVVVPVGLKFLLGFQTIQVQPAISVAACLEFALWISLGLGILYQLPVVTVTLVRWRIIDAKTLADHRRHAILSILIVAAAVTPGPDVVSQLLLAVPAYFLYEVSLLLAKVFSPKK